MMRLLLVLYGVASVLVVVYGLVVLHGMTWRTGHWRRGGYVVLAAGGVVGVAEVVQGSGLPVLSLLLFVVAGVCLLACGVWSGRRSGAGVSR
jgi:hypothetical protein